MASLLAKGTLVEVCAYRPNASFHYLGALDGCQGVVSQIKGHGQKCSATVDLESKWHSGPVDIPVAALREIKTA